jgi:transcriptional regulator with XRE-family HTH domain
VAKTLGELLGQWMNTNDKTAADVARIADVSDSTVGRWINGRTKTMKVGTVKKLSEGTGIKASELLIASGFTAEQLGAKISVADPSEWTNEQLLEFVRVRMVEPPRSDDLSEREPAGPRVGEPEETGRSRRFTVVNHDSDNGNGDDGGATDEEPDDPR